MGSAYWLAAYDFTVAIRPARATDVATLSRLALESKASWGYDEEFMERCRGELVVRECDVDEQLVYVALEGGCDDAVGFYVLKERGESDGELDMLFVDPSHMGEGVGRSLLVHSQSEARRRGWLTMRIESDPFAASFYERHGAVLVGSSRSPSTGRDLPLYVMHL